ncbi:hypothetical protein E2P81_ATG07528 [Venturia nashicola]|uniref:Uncharacterized protein n=1 Tax=Venturia nashicola TaxID=86259 RepID=A0A4Z1PFI4_9PEZI|nr:hypothetical protein E6O75_ATG07688 [Venturia nashicola]TLD32038.1 hypothetical protein E2P81_ATG07528 [Venturia nashicola]
MKMYTMALVTAVLFSSVALAIPVQGTALTRKPNGENILMRQTVQWPENEVEVCTDAHFKGHCQKEPQYINTCWPFKDAFNTSISSIRFDSSETATAGAMSCSFYETTDCTFVLVDGTKRPVLHLLGPIDDLSTTQFNDKLQSVRCNRLPKPIPHSKESKVITKRDDLLCLKLCEKANHGKCGAYHVEDGVQCLPANQCHTINVHLGLSSVVFDRKIQPDGSRMRCSLYTDNTCGSHLSDDIGPEWLDLNHPMSDLERTGFNDHIASYRCYHDMHPFDLNGDECAIAMNC